MRLRMDRDIGFEMILKAARRLPKPIRKVLSWIGKRRNSKIVIGRGLVRHLAEYFGLSYEETVCMLKLGARLNADLWKILNPGTKEEIEKFYMLSPYCIFDLAYWHMKIAQRRFRQEIVKLCKGDILDYGAGIGDLCIELCRKGLNVDHADVSGRTFEFAKWLFKKKGYNIKMIDLTKEKLSKDYDTILCLDVIEHVHNPKMLLQELSDHLKNNGNLIITGLKCQDVSENHPMHFKIEFDAEIFLNSLGLFKCAEKKEWLWAKKLSAGV